MHFALSTNYKVWCVYSSKEGSLWSRGFFKRLNNLKEVFFFFFCSDAAFPSAFPSAKFSYTKTALSFTQRYLPLTAGLKGEKVIHENCLRYVSSPYFRVQNGRKLFCGICWSSSSLQCHECTVHLPLIYQRTCTTPSSFLLTHTTRTPDMWAAFKQRMNAGLCTAMYPRSELCPNITLPHISLQMEKYKTSSCFSPFICFLTERVSLFVF